MKYNFYFLSAQISIFIQYKSSQTWNLISFKTKYLVFISEIGLYVNFIILRPVCVCVPCVSCVGMCVVCACVMCVHVYCVCTL